MYGDSVLRAQTQPIADAKATFTVPGFEPVDRRALARNMLETMYEAEGVGLAAPQIGLPLRMFVAAEYDDDHADGQPKPLRARVLREFVFINPMLEVIDPTPESRYLDGCLSIPGVYEDGVMRPQAIRITYSDEHGARHQLEADDYFARVVQHEYDHLFGRLFLDLLPAAVTEKHRSYLVQLQREAKAYLKSLGKNRDQR
jgi:peptide deformylase